MRVQAKRDENNCGKDGATNNTTGPVDKSNFQSRLSRLSPNLKIKFANLQLSWVLDRRDRHPVLTRGVCLRAREQKRIYIYIERERGERQGGTWHKAGRERGSNIKTERDNKL